MSWLFERNKNRAALGSCFRSGPDKLRVRVFDLRYCQGFWPRNATPNPVSGRISILKTNAAVGSFLKSISEIAMGHSRSTNRAFAFQVSQSVLAVLIIIGLLLPHAQAEERMMFPARASDLANESYWNMTGDHGGSNSRDLNVARESGSL